jgi:hypothetical protein
MNRHWVLACSLDHLGEGRLRHIELEGVADSDYARQSERRT